MKEPHSEKSKRLGIVALLILQLILLFVSLDAVMEISVFCTASESALLAWGVSILHFSFLVLLLLGVFAIPLPQVRVPYVFLLLLALLALPVQALLVDRGQLSCDAF